MAGTSAAPTCSLVVTKPLVFLPHLLLYLTYIHPLFLLGALVCQHTLFIDIPCQPFLSTFTSCHLTHFPTCFLGPAQDSLKALSVPNAYFSVSSHKPCLLLINFWGIISMIDDGLAYNIFQALWIIKQCTCSTFTTIQQVMNQKILCINNI